MPHRTAPPLPLLILLVAFPQLSETIYAPVLPGIARAFAVSEASAQLTMSIYFVAFALGVVCWGRLADRLGRRPSMLLGLACYCAGALWALLAPDFNHLLAARFVLAFGASAGSVLVQTMLRDRFEGAALVTLFSTIAMVLSLSPALGPPLGSALAGWLGHLGVFSALCLLGIGLVLASFVWLPETRLGIRPATVPLRELGRKLLLDKSVCASAWLVAGFNLILFGFYTLAPFTLAALQQPAWLFGASGLVIAAGSALGAWLNRRWLRRYSAAMLIRYSVYASIAVSAAQLIWLMSFMRQTTLAIAGLLVTQLLLVVAYGCAIPNLLSGALRSYPSMLGSAGALFGLGYYLLISGGLGLMSALYQPSPGFQPLVMLAVSLAMWPVLRRLH